jgi:hypothetical protein
MSDDKANEQNDEEAPKGRARGGKARAESLSGEEKREIAKKAALARWGPKATHKGNFKDEFGIDVDCYVLNDANKSAVISQRGMGEALGFRKGDGSAFRRFTKGSKFASFAGVELIEKLENPLIFQGQPAGPNIPPQRIYGFDVTILIDICKAVIAAETAGVLSPERHKKIIRQAHVILTASAKAGIRGLVYALSGYEPSKEEVIEAFKMYVREEAREYEREFPEQLYREWYRLYQLPELEKNKRPWKFKHLTINQVYYPLAKSNGKIFTLAKHNRDSSGKMHQKIHQFLADVGVKALRQHLGQLLGIAQVSPHQAQYEKHVANVFGGQWKLFE